MCIHDLHVFEARSDRRAEACGAEGAIVSRRDKAMGQLSSPQTFTYVRLKELSGNPSNAMQSEYRLKVDVGRYVRD